VSSADPRIDFATGARLRVWSRVWRYLLVVLFSIVGWLGMYALFAVEVEDGTTPDSMSFWALAIIDPIVWLIAMGLLPLRRRIPATVAIATGLLSSFSVMASTGPAQLAAASNATHRRWAPIVAGLLAGVIGSTIYSRFVPEGFVEEFPWWLEVAGSTVGFAVPVTFGLYIGARRALIASLHDRALEAERERELQIAAAEAGERTRIAREMHDVLAHRISLVAMHAGALAYRDDLSREQVRGTAVLVQENSRRALTELRQVLGVLRADGSEGIEPPQPTLDTLPTLLDEARAAGAVIDASGSVAGEVPELISRTAFRIAQEALTNARKHAPGAAIGVRIDGHAGGLLAVEVTNGTARAGAASIPGSGVGLAGLAERVELAGGTLEYGPDGKGGFAVRAWLPWEECDD
jgi:signal transduction histidine kinase